LAAQEYTAIVRHYAQECQQPITICKKNAARMNRTASRIFQYFFSALFFVIIVAPPQAVLFTFYGFEFFLFVGCLLEFAFIQTAGVFFAFFPVSHGKIALIKVVRIW